MYLLLLGLCYLTNDIIAAERTIESYIINYNIFTNNEKCTLLRSLLEATKNFDLELFYSSINKYEKICGLSKLEMKLLLMIKNKFDIDLI